jgi:cytochrome c-type biogenesis protein CcmE
MKRKHKTMALIVGGVAGLGIAATLVLSAMNKNLVFFFSPTQVAAKEAPVEKAFRLGGLVKKGSVERANDGLTVSFLVTDNATEIPVIFTGILPDLFKEGTGVVAQGRLQAGVFQADEVLAKHDEKYMPPEVADALKKGEQAAAQKTAESLVTN